MKNHETNTTPLQGLATVTMEYIKILLAFFKTKVDGNLQQKWPCSAQYYHRRADIEKSNPVRHSRQLVGSINKKTFLRTHYRNATSERSNMSLDSTILLPSFRNKIRCFHIMVQENQPSVHIVRLLFNLYLPDKLVPVPEFLSEDDGNEDKCTIKSITQRSNRTSMHNMHTASLAGEATYAKWFACKGSPSWNEDGAFPRQCTCYLNMMLRQHPTIFTCILNGHQYAALCRHNDLAQADSITYLVEIICNKETLYSRLAPMVDLM